MNRFKSCLLPFCLVLTLIISGCSDRDKRAANAVEHLYLPDMNLLFEDYELADSTKAYSDYGYRIAQANRDLQSSELFLEAASLYQMAGRTDSVAVLIHRAIDAGMANPNILDRIIGNQPLPKEPQWILLSKRLDSIREQLRSISNFELEMDAMEEFWPYLQRALEDTIRARSVFKEYIFQGPRELRDFYAVRYYSTDAMYGQMVNAAPDYYSYLRGRFRADSLQALKSKTVRWMQKFQELYPEAVFPKVYVVPGILNSGGTATSMGLFVGGDMYGRGPQMPTHELTEWQQNSVMDFSSLPSLTLHELMHFQQNYRDTARAETVLFKLVEEGVCDFLLELASGESLDNENLRFLENPEQREQIMIDLKRDLMTEDLSRWMYNGGSIHDRPHDLGYTLGYLISKSYYQGQADKKKAVYELLNTDDMARILEGSEYAHLLDPYL